MEINNKNTVSAAGNQQKSSFLSALNAKRKKIAITLTTMFVMNAMMAVSAFAASGDSGGLDTNAGTAEFNAVIEFFATWIGRIGLIVGFVGAIMFGLAIKNDDADAKTRGLMTLASGFVVFAVTKALGMFMK